MQALVTLLPDPYNQWVEKLWVDLGAHFGCRHLYNRPKPHFTWQYAEEYAPYYPEILEPLSRKLEPIEIQTDIITSFSELDPVLFLRIIKTPELLDTHRILWEELLPLWREPSLFYEPGVWVPHITLSMDSWCDIAGARKFLSDMEFRWTIKVHSMVMLHLGEENAWDVEREFRFGSG